MKNRWIGVLLLVVLVLSFAMGAAAAEGSRDGGAAARPNEFLPYDD